MLKTVDIVGLQDITLTAPVTGTHMEVSLVNTFPGNVVVISLVNTTSDSVWSTVMLVAVAEGVHIVVELISRAVTVWSRRVVTRGGGEWSSS